MFKLIVGIEADGDKRAIYQLKEELLQKAAQHSCRCDITISDNAGFQESISATFQPIIDIPAEDIIDMTLTGDQLFELLEHKEEK